MKIQLVRKIIKKITRWWYWLFVFLIFLGQLFFTLNSTNKILLEELSESVRNVYWLQNRAIYDGVSSNVGWYGTLLIIYNIFGFFLFEAKFFRLIIHLISLIFLAKLLKKYMGEKKACLPLMTIALSPTLLYFNTLQTSFGIDLQYFPICLYLLLSLNFSKPIIAMLKQFILWSLAMIASMSYPTFLAYLPILFIIYIVVLHKSKKILTRQLIFKNILISLISFCLPIIIVFSYLKEPQLLIYDSHVNSGIFRGGGGERIPHSQAAILNNINTGTKLVKRDLFNFPGSFYFETNIIQAEFSHKLLFWLVIFILLISLWLFLRVKQARLALGLSWLLMLTSLFVGNFSGFLPGIRRSTGFLAGLYAVYIVVWKYNDRKYLGNSLLVLLVLFSLLGISFHHLKVYSNNRKALLYPSLHAADACFNKIPGNPAKSLDKYINQAKNGEQLNNNAEDDKINVCRLHAIYSAAAGSCLWNHLNCPPLWGYDENTKGFILLSTTLWEKYYFNH